MFGRIVARPIFEYSFPIDYRQSLECLPGARKRCGRTGKESLDIVDCLGACFLHGAEACHPDMHLRGIASDGPRCIAEERDLLAQEKLKEAEGQIHQMKKIEMIGQMTGGVAHDFNNLLTPIVGYLDFLQVRFADDAKASKMISAALLSADRGRVLDRTSTRLNSSH